MFSFAQSILHMIHAALTLVGPRPMAFVFGMLLLLWVLPTSGSLLAADTVILKDGTTLRGKIIRVSTGRHLLIRVGGRVRRIPLKNIRSMRKGRPRRANGKAVTRKKRPPERKIAAVKADSAKSAKRKKTATDARSFWSPLIPWLPGLVQYGEGRRARGIILGATFTSSLLASLYYSLTLASIRREAAAGVAYNLYLDRTTDNRFRRVRGRLDASRLALVATAAVHGWDLYHGNRAAKSGPVLKAGFHESGAFSLSLRFHLNFSRFDHSRSHSRATAPRTGAE